jgi:hypothetical protein
MSRLLAFMYVSSFSVAWVICRARATMRDGDCSEALSAAATLGAGAGAPLASASFCRSEEDRAEKDRRFCFLTSASVLAGELDWKRELNLNLDIFRVSL